MGNFSNLLVHSVLCDHYETLKQNSVILNAYFFKQLFLLY